MYVPLEVIIVVDQENTLADLDDEIVEIAVDSAITAITFGFKEYLMLGEPCVINTSSYKFAIKMETELLKEEYGSMKFTPRVVITGTNGQLRM